MPSELNDPNIPIVYCNTTHIAVGVSDVCVTFGSDFFGMDSEIITNWHHRVVFTHSQFAQMMAFWESRENFIKEVYNGIPPTLNTIREEDPIRYNKLVQTWLIRPDDNESDDTEGERE